MPFSKQQIDALGQPINPDNVKTRKQAKNSSLELAYVESWHVINEANRIFGFDGWNSETVDLKLVSSAQDPYGNEMITYIAKSRVTVGGVVKEGVGAGHGRGKGNTGEKHESAIKEAESDARKRALMQFGNQFGLSLYDAKKEWLDPPRDNDSWRKNNVSIPTKHTYRQQDEPPPLAKESDKTSCLSKCSSLYLADRDLYGEFEAAYCLNFSFTPTPQCKISHHIQEPKHTDFVLDWFDKHPEAVK